MTDFEDEPKAIPTRVRRLSDEAGGIDPRTDRVVPLAAAAALVGVLGLTCAPISTAFWYATARDAAASEAAASTTASTRPTLPAGGPGPTALLLVGLFVGVALLGIVGGIFTILYRDWGRRLLLAYAAAVLLYLVGVVAYRLNLGVEGVTESAPTTSALILFFTCTGGVLLAVAALMVIVLRYFTRPDVARRFG